VVSGRGDERDEEREGSEEHRDPHEGTRAHWGSFRSIDPLFAPDGAKGSIAGDGVV
jgi:hypothetical protein